MLCMSFHHQWFHYFSSHSRFSFSIMFVCFGVRYGFYALTKSMTLIAIHATYLNPNGRFMFWFIYGWTVIRFVFFSMLNFKMMLSIAPIFSHVEFLMNNIHNGWMFFYLKATMKPKSKIFSTNICSIQSLLYES